MSTKVINLFAGPGAGKSTTATLIHGLLKSHDVNSEYASEYAKDVTWRNAQGILTDQLYVLAKQNHKLTYLKDQVDVIVTDSPILLSLVYANPLDTALRTIVLDRFSRHDNRNYFINRTKKYNPAGRNQTEEQSRDLDKKIKKMLVKEGINFEEVEGGISSVNYITYYVLKELGIEPRFGIDDDLSGL